MLFLKVNLHFKSGNTLTFFAKNFKWKHDNDSITSWNAEGVVNIPSYWNMKEVEAITAKVVFKPILAILFWIKGIK